MMLKLPVSIYVRFFRLAFGYRFRRFGRNVYFIFPAGVDGAKNIELGDDVYIAYKTFLAALPHTGHPACVLSIGSGSRIGRFNHIYATQSVVIGANVLTANNVYISDNLHGYKDPSIPISQQPILQNGTVEIGEGSWLGHNAVVLGAHIGKQCVIGANAVVTSNIPDHCVAVGVPAVIIQRFDHTTQTWRRTSADGSFVADATDTNTYKSGFRTT
jgi:acetyltransferase-like isoleucine patch superfamily enzyme